MLSLFLFIDVFCFFFFKQKTAYEMRISDWSSDVCSSDLIGRIGVAEERPVDAGRQPPVRLQRRDPRAEFALRALLGGDVDTARRRQQIGRASCRERVC